MQAAVIPTRLKTVSSALMARNRAGDYVKRAANKHGCWPRRGDVDDGMTSKRMRENKAPETISRALCLSWRTARVPAVLSAWGYLPDAWVRAFSMAPGEHIILMNEPSPIIDRCGQLIAIRNFADKA